MSNDNSKTRFIAFRCPNDLFDKMFNVKDNKGRDVTTTLIHNLESGFILLELLDKMVSNMTEKQLEKILNPVIASMDPRKVDDYIEFAEIYEKGNRK